MRANQIERSGSSRASRTPRGAGPALRSISSPWQDGLVRKLYGTVKPDGNRRFRIVYCEIPKKNGKSELAAGIGLKQLVADGEQGG